MTREAAMAEASVPVDLFNPGHVFACLGLVEATGALLGHAEGAFDWSQPVTRFWVRGPGDASPVERVLAFFDRAKVRAVAPAGSPNVEAWKSSWGEVPETTRRDDGYPIADPKSPATLVCKLSDDDAEIRVDHWGDSTNRDSVKFWAGAAGKPGTTFLREALEAARGKMVEAAQDPLNLAATRSSSLRFDWRGDYLPIDAGFSLNNHGDRFTSRSFPVVDVLAAIGLTHARPSRPDRRDKLIYRYGVAGRDRVTPQLWLPAPLLRASLGGPPLPFPMRRFLMQLSWPGQENQARVITTVTEES
jgi:CRISPR-associated protein Csx14